MITKSHHILYVADQALSTEFYSKLLNQLPHLNVPGMTEFQLTENTILGLMPSKGITKLLENKIETYPSSENKGKSELYLIVDNLNDYYNRAISLKAHFLSEIKEQDWGHKTVYLLDPDSYVIAFAEIIEDIIINNL